MKFKIFFVFSLTFSALPLCAITEELLNEQLINATNRGKLREVESCLLRGANVNARDKRKKTPLIIATGWGYTKIVRLLLLNQAYVNVTCKPSTIPLILAVGETDRAKLLRLDYSISPFKPGMTALMFAAKYGFPSIINMLLKHSAKIDSLDEIDFSALTYATATKHFKCIEQLLKYINHHIDQTDDPKIWQKWDQYILDALSRTETHWWWRSDYRIDLINAFRMILHHASKLPLSRKKLESLTAKALGKTSTGEEAFRKTIKHLRKHAF